MTTTHSRLGRSVAMLSLIFGPVRAQTLAERLLTPADLGRLGLKVIRPPAETWDPADGLHFVRASDSMLVLTVASLNSIKTSGELRTTVSLLDKDAAPVSGVGDEAYSGLDGMLLVFRKGSAIFQLMSGLDPLNLGKPS